MDDKDFLGFLDDISSYLNKEKILIPNVKKIPDVMEAVRCVREIEKSADVHLEMDALESGCVFLVWKDYSFVFQEEKQIKKLERIIDLADNIEVVPTEMNGEPAVQFSAGFQNAYIVKF